MYQIIGNVDTGKTRKLLELAKAQDGVVCCETPQRMRQKAHAYGITGLDIVSWDEINLACAMNQPVFIDDLDQFIQYIIPRLRGYSLNITNNVIDT